MEAQSSRYHLHEGYFAHILELEHRKDLDSFLLRLENGGHGSKSDITWQANPAPYDIPIRLQDKSTVNKVNFYYEFKGNRRKRASLSDPSQDTINERGRWFAIGNPSGSSGNISVQRQIDLVRYVIGTHQGLRTYPVQQEDPHRRTSIAAGRRTGRLARRSSGLEP